MKKEIKFTLIGLAILAVGVAAYVFTAGDFGAKDKYTPVPASEIELNKPAVQSDKPLFVPAQNKHWGYTNGAWMPVENSSWGSIMYGTMTSIQDQGIAQVGRRAHFVTDSSFATLALHNVGDKLRVYVDGSLKVEQNLTSDRKRIEIPIYKGYTGKHEIMVVWGSVCELAGIYISKDATIYRYENDQQKMVMIGNSYVQGTKTVMGGITSFAAQLNDRLGLEIVNQGVMDSDVDIAYSQMEHSSGLDRVKLDVAYEKPDYVFVSYGIVAVKSIMKGEMQQQQYFDDYKRFIEQIRAELPDVPIFCSGIISVPTYSDETLKPYNEGIRNAIREVGNTYFIDLSGCWNESNYKTYVSDDLLNPSEAGHKFLADKYTEFIKPYIKK